MKLRLTFLFLSAILPIFLAAQVDSVSLSSLSKQEAVILPDTKSIMFDSLQENRLTANVKMKVSLKEALEMKGAFDFPFDSLKTVSFQYPSDSSFRVVTWQLYVDVDEYQYFGFIQTNAETPVVTPLIDKSETVDDIHYDVLTPEQWYGAVYYKIKSFKTDEGDRHLLFGFDGHSLFKKRKVVDVLYFDEGKARFGAPVFSPVDTRRTDLYKNRIIKEYSVEAPMTLNYNEDMGMIVMDHLIPFRTSAQVKEETLVPDGSYDGYKLEGNIWVFQEKLFRQVSETAPRPEPILDKRKGKNIAGKKQ